jgi:excisionase family DNA binding protein
MIGWLDISALSEYCCTSPRTIEMWIKERGLRYSRVRGKRLIKREWLDQFLESHEASKNHEQVDSIVTEILENMK